MKDSDEKVNYDQPQEFEEAGTSKKIEGELSDENDIILGDETPGEPAGGCPVKRKRNFWLILILFIIGLLLLILGGRSCGSENQDQQGEETVVIIE